MIKNKFFLISFIFLIISFILTIIISSFLFGVKVGVTRKAPYFDTIFKLYNMSQNFDFSIKRILDKNRLQKIKKSDPKINDNQLIFLANKIGSQTGKIPKNLIIASTLSILENEIVNHYLIFLKQNEIIHKINLEEDKFKEVKNYFKWPHGLIINNENEIYFNFDSGNSLIKKNLCGDTIWEIEGKFHHLMSANNDYLWVLKKENYGNYDTAEKFLKLDSSNGKILQSFSTHDIIKANLPYDYFSIKQRDLSSIWEYEPFHFNDVDVLTNEFSNYFKDYNEGDLLISSRSLNSIFVLDPLNLKIKKFIFGLSRRQHDPDWNKGYITLYDNQTEWGYDIDGKAIRPFNSRIIKLKQLKEDTLETVNYNTSFISDARGNHDILDIDNNNIFSLIVSPYEGKLLLFKSNSLIYSLENNQKGEILPISNGKIINNLQILDNIKKCQN